MVANRVDGEADDLGVAFVELGLELGHVAQLRGADWREVLRMREQDRPFVADPLVKADRSFGRFSREVGRFITNAYGHL